MTVEFGLVSRDVSVWDVTSGSWVQGTGKFTISVGGSSRSLPLNAPVTL